MNPLGTAIVTWAWLRRAVTSDPTDAVNGIAAPARTVGGTIALICTSPATALPARFDVGAPASAGVWGNDTLYGDGGDDLQLAEDGNDTLYGGAGDDDMYGELGDDRMFGEGGEDAMLGDRFILVCELQKDVLKAHATCFELVQFPA